MPVMSQGLQSRIRGNEVSGTIGDNVIRSQMSIGPEKRRRRSTARVDKFPLRMTLNVTELTEFISFYDTDLRDGSLSFDMTHPVTGVVRQFAFTSSTYNYRSIGNSHYYLTAELDLLP